jgi:hypothetical protein
MTTKLEEIFGPMLDENKQLPEVYGVPLEILIKDYD